MDPKVPILGALEFVVLLSKGDGITNHSDFNLVQETEDFLGPQPPILGEPETGSPPGLGDLGGLETGIFFVRNFLGRSICSAVQSA